MLDVFVGVLAALSLRDIILWVADYYKQHRRAKNFQAFLDRLEDEEADDDYECDDEDCYCKD